MNQAKLLRRAAVACLAFFITSAFGPSPCRADTEIWEIMSTYPYKVQIEFYSMDRRGLSWPGRGRAFTLYDSKMHKFDLECRFGEKICWGAWDVTNRGTTGSKYWGVGENNQHSCTACCWTCGLKGEPRSINLTQ